MNQNITIPTTAEVAALIRRACADLSAGEINEAKATLHKVLAALAEIEAKENPQ